MSNDWPFEIGTTLPRKQVHAKVGGQQQQGIVTPQGWPDVLVFTDPVKGKRFGYDRFEGLRADGCYSYTGAGPERDQVFLRGNKWLRDAEREGKTIRLFRSQGSLTTYIGAFTLGDPPYEWKQIPAERGPDRKGIIFNLAPLEADVSTLPLYGGEKFTSKEPQQVPWTPPSFDAYEIGPAEANQRTVSRVEFELQADFGNWLKVQGHELGRLRIPAGSGIIEPDLFNATLNQIVEAKKSSARGYVRMAIGQVLDYLNNVTDQNPDISAAILLPGAPASDLIALCRKLGIGIWVRHGSAFSQI